MDRIDALKNGLAALLTELDALTGDRDDEEAEALEELNAELEDALLLLDELRKDDEDWQEEFDGAIEEFAALASDYLALSDRVEGLWPLAKRLESALKD